MVGRKENVDTLEVRVEMNESLFSDSVKAVERVENEIHKKLDSVLGISAKVTLVEPFAIERSEGKAKRVIDKRELK